jgi:hypothetical protein
VTVREEVAPFGENRVSKFDGKDRLATDACRDEAAATQVEFVKLL